MSKIPTAGPHTEGRTLGTDWSIANVAKLLRSSAGAGAWRSGGPAGASNASANQYYLRKTSAKHMPSNLSVIFMRLEKENCWYASLCFTEGDRLLPWDAETAEQWLWALFGEDRPRAREEASNSDPSLQEPGARQFTLSMTAPPARAPRTV